MTLDERIRRYLARCPASIAGSGGDNQLYKVACGLRRRFSLEYDDLLNWLRVFNAKCQPPWLEHRLAHKAKEALKNVRVATLSLGRFGRSAENGIRERRGPRPVPLLLKAPRGDLRTLRTFLIRLGHNARTHTSVKESTAIKSSEASGEHVVPEGLATPSLWPSTPSERTQPTADIEIADEPLVRYAFALFGPGSRIIEIRKTAA